MLSRLLGPGGPGTGHSPARPQGLRGGPGLHLGRRAGTNLGPRCGLPVIPTRDPGGLQADSAAGDGDGGVDTKKSSLPARFKHSVKPYDPALSLPAGPPAPWIFLFTAPPRLALTWLLSSGVASRKDRPIPFSAQAGRSGADGLARGLTPHSWDGRQAALSPAHAAKQGPATGLGPRSCGGLSGYPWPPRLRPWEDKTKLWGHAELNSVHTGRLRVAPPSVTPT